LCLGVLAVKIKFGLLRPNPAYSDLLKTPSPPPLWTGGVKLSQSSWVKPSQGKSSRFGEKNYILEKGEENTTGRRSGYLNLFKVI
jgi:hypothetical protein